MAGHAQRSKGLKRTLRASSQWRNLPFHPRAPVFISPPGVLACHVVKVCEVGDAVLSAADKVTKIESARRVTPGLRTLRAAPNAETICNGRSGPGQSRGSQRQDLGPQRQARRFHIR